MNILKRLLILILFYLLVIHFFGCIDVGITTPGIVDNVSTCSIEDFGITSFKEGEIELKWQIDGEYDEIVLSRRETGGSYETLTILKDCSQDNYIDKTIDSGKIYIYKIEAKSGSSVQDSNKYALFSSYLESGRANIIYNINLSDPNTNQYKVEMWISKSYSAPLRFRSESYHPHGSTLHVLNWNYQTSDGISVYGNPDSGIEVNGMGRACICYEAELPPVITSDIYGILGLFSNQFFLASGVQYLLLVQESDKENIDLIYKIYNTDFNWKVLSPEFSPEDKLFIIDFSDVDGNYFAYQENTVLCYPSGEFLVESNTIDGTEVIMAIEKNINNYIKYKERFFEIFNNTSSIFEEGVGEKYIASIVYYNEKVWTSENTYSQGFSHAFDYGIYDLLAHQIFHRWNGWEPYCTYFISDNPKWDHRFYAAGWNRFFIDWNLNQVVPGFYWNYLRNFYQTYQEEYYDTSKDMPVAAAGTEVNIHFYKGGLVTYLLNKEVKEQTDGMVSMVDVQREIWNRYGNEMGFFSYNDIIEIINELTNSDFSKFFNDYVFGKEKIVIPEFE